jgi:hypothetical protein
MSNDHGTRIELYAISAISIVAFGLLYFLAVLSPGVEGGMDSYNHYLIARFSWQHPGELLLDQWGKPLYNILASPFAQFGLIGVEIFNILLLIGTAWVTYFTARGLNFAHAWVAFLLALASPIFFDNVISGLTEPLNAFLLITTVYLFVKDKVFAGAILAGFLPFARSEGFVIMAVVGFYLLFIRRSYKGFGLLLFGSVFMNLIGWIVEGEPFWVITSNPYIKYQVESLVEKKNICGNGDWDHYLVRLKWIIGIPRLVLFGLGTALVSLLYLRNPRDKILQKLFYLVLGIYFLYFAIHSFIWYKGIMGSCGYERVMVVIDPLAAILMAFIFELILRFSKDILSGKWRFVFNGLLAIFFMLVLYWPWRTYGAKYPIDISDEQKLFVEAADWYNQSSYEDRMKYFLYPYFNMLTGIDPKDHDHFTEIWSFDEEYAPVGSIVIWDGHFGPNEGNVPLKLLQNHHDFRLIKSFYPPEPFKTSNNYDFEIHVFERIQKTQ